MLLVQMMLGPKAYGFPVGQRMGNKSHPQICTQADEQKHWFNFTLPAPENLKSSHVATNSCLIMLILFLIAPQLKHIPAFNLGGGWKHKKTLVEGKQTKRRRSDDDDVYRDDVYPHGELKVGFTQSGDDCLMLASITILSVEAQLELRKKLSLRNGEQTYLAMPTSRGERNRKKRAQRKTSK